MHHLCPKIKTFYVYLNAMSRVVFALALRSHNDSFHTDRQTCFKPLVWALDTSVYQYECVSVFNDHYSFPIHRVRDGEKSRNATIYFEQIEIAIVHLHRTYYNILWAFMGDLWGKIRQLSLLVVTTIF